MNTDSQAALTGTLMFLFIVGSACVLHSVQGTHFRLSEFAALESNDLMHKLLISIFLIESELKKIKRCSSLQTLRSALDSKGVRLFFSIGDFESE